MTEYVRKVEPLIAELDWRFLARGGGYDVMEGEWRPDVFVLIEFPGRAAIHRFLDSEEYRSLKALRLASAMTNIGVAV